MYKIFSELVSPGVIFYAGLFFPHPAKNFSVALEFILLFLLTQLSGLRYHTNINRQITLDYSRHSPFFLLLTSHRLRHNPLASISINNAKSNR